MRRASAAVIAACVFAGGVGVPVTALAKDKAGLPPGQEKKVDPAWVPPGQAKQDDAPAQAAPEPTATPQPKFVAAPEPTAAPTAAPVNQGSGKKLPPGLAKKQPAVLRATPTVAPAATAAPTSTAGASAAPAATTPSQSGATVAPTARAARRTTGSGSGTARSRARERRAAQRRSGRSTTAPRRSRTVAQITAGTPAATSPAGRAAKPRAGAKAKRPVARRAERPAAKPVLRTITRNVERVVEVVPAPVRAGVGILIALALLLGAGLLIAALRARGLERQRRRLTADVGLLQSALLPDLAETGTGPATVTAAYRPAEGLAAGGDFYDAFALDEHRTAIVVGDVSGHGRDAVPLTASVRYTVRAYLEGGLGPRHVLQVAGRVLDEQLRERMVTIVVAIYDARTGLLTYASAGHPPPVVVGDEVQPVLAYASPAVGLGVPTGRRQVTVPLAPGAVACFYTDGMADVLTDGDRLGLVRLAEAVHELSPDEGAQELVARVVRRSDSRPDDMAAVVVRPPEDAPAVRAGRIEELEVDASDLRRDRLQGFLAAFGVSEGVADAAVRAAADNIARAGACVIAVHHDEGGATVAVEDTPHVVSLPLAAGSRDVSRHDILPGDVLAGTS